MGRKRKASLPWCYYCEREFEDEKVLLLHQKAKHFKCGSCNKQYPNIGAMKSHALKSHGENVLKVRGVAWRGDGWAQRGWRRWARARGVTCARRTRAAAAVGCCARRSAPAASQKLCRACVRSSAALRACRTGAQREAGARQLRRQRGGHGRHPRRRVRGCARRAARGCHAPACANTTHAPKPWQPTLSAVCIIRARWGAHALPR
jgi:hypothetical protein